ncbi:MAG: hypothetical protein V3W41_09240 [Planctomycetota bacterium]
MKGVSQVKVDCAQAKAWITMKNGYSLDRQVVSAALTKSNFELVSFQEPKGKGADKVTYWKMVYTRGGG